MTKRLLVSTVILLTAFGVIISAGCTGPSGPDGDNALLTDSLPPVISWISPESGITVSDTVTLAVDVKDNQYIWKVVFYIGGFEYESPVTDTLHCVCTYLWDTDNFPSAPFPVSVRAWDRARNQSSTNVIVINH